MIRPLILSLFVLGLTAVAALAQSSPADKPSMEPNAPVKKDPFGLNPLQKERPKDAKTEITAKKQATFDNAANLAEFEGNVIVKDPQFTLYCDKLVVSLNKNQKGLEKAEAVGSVTIVQESTDEAGKVTKSIGRAGKAVYTPATGDIVLTISPSIQSGVNYQIGEPETIMTLNRAGRSETVGPSKSVIINSDEKTPL